MGLWPTKADGNPLANARGSAWDAHCKQSRDRKGALEVWTFNGADGNPLADARGSAWDAHCKQSRDRKGADARRIIVISPTSRGLKFVILDLFGSGSSELG